MDNIIIRKAKTKDAKEIINYLNQVGGESDNLLFGFNEFSMSIEDEKAYIKKINSSFRDCMLIALIDNEIVGIASLQGYNRIRVEHRGNLAVSVKKKYWHQGIATKIIKRLIDFAKERKIVVIELEVKSDNFNAINLYKKLGFEKIGVYKKFLKINEKFYDAYLMNLYLIKDD